MRKILLAVIFLTPSLALAQQQASPSEQALGQKLMQEITAGIQCSTQNIALRFEMEKAQAEVKRLTEKYEPKKNEPKK